MICPIGPYDVDSAAEAVDQIKPQCCEQIWAEPLNVRGKSLVKTRDALLAADLGKEAHELERVMRDKNAWRQYCMELFTALQTEMDKCGQLNKLRFLQYVKREPEEFKKAFIGKEGSVCL